MQKVLSSRSRMERVVSDIVFDFSVKPRLSSERGNAMLVAGSIYEACKYYALFQKTSFKGRCALVTSYSPQTGDITLEDTGANTDTDKEFIYDTYTTLLEDVDSKPGMSKTEVYEEWAKNLFIREPTNMRLLIVVDKLLTGFDAPACTYLYIDKSMKDHGLFQAICRTNRLDGDDKDFGYIVDYKDLFKKVENAIAVYSSELDHTAGGVDPEVLLRDRLKRARERLDSALEEAALLCEHVQPPKGDLEHIRYFCGNTEIAADLEKHEPARVALYKAVASVVRGYANLADEMERAGYSVKQAAKIKNDVNGYVKLRDIIRQASGESLDLKAYEADMRHLIDTYIEADEPRKISPFDDMPLLELIVKVGMKDAIGARLGALKGSKDNVAEAIENNIRRKIIREHLSDPAFYDRMSKLLDEIIAERRAKAMEYEQYLARVAEIVRQVEIGHSPDLPPALKTPGQRALYNNLQKILAELPAAKAASTEASASGDEVLDVAIRVDESVKAALRPNWRGDLPREREIKGALYAVLKDIEAVERVFPIIKQQKEY